MSIDITREPVGAAYVQLVDAATACCASFSLVWRDDEPCDANVANALQPFLIREERINGWPGTQLTDHQLVTVRYYRLTNSNGALLKHARSLYAWQHPELPEDLAFYTSDGNLWLGSIAHEADAWLEPSAITVDEVAQQMPLLEVRVAGPSSLPGSI